LRAIENKKNERATLLSKHSGVAAIEDADIIDYNGRGSP
jgi:hypothetical protein